MNLEIIIPVGPGHEQIVMESHRSIGIAWETSNGPFKHIDINSIDDTQGKKGRSKARNEGIIKSDADWLFFLDADDLMHPHAFEVMNSYLDYQAVWGGICEYHDGLMMPRYQIPKITKIDTLFEVDPYFTLQMGFFVKRKSMILFDEELNCGEDWKVYLELWDSCFCIKQKEPFMINRRGFNSVGPKSANGKQWRESVEKIIRDFPSHQRKTEVVGKVLPFC